MNAQNENILLAESLRAGSYDAFNQLYLLYADMLFGFTFQLIRSRSNARDIVQETFLRIWLTRKQIDPHASFKSYLYTIARNLIIDSLRRRTQQVDFRSRIHSDDFPDFCENDTERQINYTEFRRQVNLAKEKLTTRQYEIFELNREKGFSISQIAEKLGLSEKTVKNQLSLALKRMRNELMGYHILLFTFIYPFT